MNLQKAEAVAAMEMLADKFNWNTEWYNDHTPLEVLLEKYLICTGPSLFDDDHDGIDKRLYKIYNLKTGILEHESRGYAAIIGVTIAIDSNEIRILEELKKYTQSGKSSEDFDGGVVH